MTIAASDQGKPARTSTVTVYMNVRDINDNAPVFDPMTYTAAVYENVTSGTSIITVQATDQDSGKFKFIIIISSFYVSSNFSILQIFEKTPIRHRLGPAKTVQ